MMQHCGFPYKNEIKITKMENMNDTGHTILSTGGNQENGSCCERELKLGPWLAVLHHLASPHPKTWPYIFILKSQFSTSLVAFS